MADTITVTANWATGNLSNSIISRQYDNNRYRVEFTGYPEDGTENLIFYLLVFMRTEENPRGVILPPVQLSSDQWLISNYFTQLSQQIRFQLCVQNEAGTFEAHSPIFKGTIVDSLDHVGEEIDIDTSALFDAYREYINQLIIAAGAVVIDTALDETSENPVQNKAVAAAINQVNGRLQQYEEVAPKEGVYPFAIAGADGKTPFYIDADGYAHYVQKYFKAEASGISHTNESGEKAEEIKTGIADFAVADADGKMLFYVLDGKMRIHAIDVDTIINGAFSDAVTKIRELKTSKYADGNFDSEINMFICYGQSWAGGYDASAITKTQRYDNIMLNTGIKNNPLNDTSQAATSFVPMVEENGTSSGSGSQTVGETPVSAQSNIVKQLIESENGYSYEDFPYQILGTSPGYGSQTLAQLSKNTNWYARLIAQVQMAYDIATALNKKLVVQAFSWAQGDLGTGLTGTYAENLEQLRADIDADVKAITGQTQTVKCITWQAFLYTNGKAKLWYEKYVGASETYPNIICSGATYHLDNVAAGNLHFTAESQDWLGAYFGIAYKRSIIDEQKFVPLKPISASHNGNALWVKFNVPQKPLVWDTDRVALADNYGFNLYDSGGTEKALTSVEIVSPDTVKFVCESAIETTDYLTYGQNGTTYNRLTGNRGNLRDTQGNYITYLSGANTVLPMHNWCVIFDKTVAEMEA